MAHTICVSTPPNDIILATLIVIVVVILVITLPMLIKFITPEKENKIVVNEVTTLAKLPEAEIKRNEELQPMMKPTTPPPPLKSTIKFTAPVIKKRRGSW